MQETLLSTIIESTKGKFFGVTFRKANGSIRFMNCRIGVQKHTNGKGLKYNPKKKGNIIVWDTQQKGYRTIKLSSIKSIRFEGKELWISNN
tara:strand:+ start:21414 stop:21686 length:273 start_codon:yes stop_codon:yes gene_type:complete